VTSYGQQFFQAYWRKRRSQLCGFHIYTGRSNHVAFHAYKWIQFGPERSIYLCWIGHSQFQEARDRKRLHFKEDQRREVLVWLKYTTVNGNPCSICFIGW